MPRIAPSAFALALTALSLVIRPVIGRCKARRRSRVRARHHRLDGRPDRRRQAQDLVDRHRHRRLQSRRRHPHGPRRLSRHRRRLRHQEDRTHPRHPGSLRQPSGTEGARRRRLAGKRQRGARCRRQQAAMDLRRRHQADRVPGRRRAAAHGLRAGHQISGHAVGGQAEGHHRQRGAGRRCPRYRAGVARHRAERQRPLHSDPAGRRPGRHHRDAVRRGHHHPAAGDQRHRDPLRAARDAEAHRGQDQAIVARSPPPRRRRPPRWRAISTSAPGRRPKP